MGAKSQKYMLFDCSARFYPIIASKKSQSVYHICVRLDQSVDVPLLERALGEVIARFPAYKVKQKAGYSQYKLVDNDAPIKVFPFNGQVISSIDKKATNGYLFKVSVDGEAIHLDMFHGLCDGSAAFEFVKAILRRYRELQGVAFDGSENIMSVDDAPDLEECEDAFLRYYKPIKLGQLDLKGMTGTTPFRLAGTFNEGGYLRSEYRVPSAEALKAAKGAGASLTAYVAGALAMCFEELSGGKRPVVIMIPVNLRNVFPSRTQKNFTLFARVTVRPDKCKSLAEYVEEAKEQLKADVAPEKLSAQISTTVKGMTNFAVRALPIFLKRFFARVGRLVMRSRQTVILSNLGKLDLDDKLGVTDVVFNLNASRNNVENLAVQSFKGETIFSFTRAILEDDLDKKFELALAEQGMDVKRTA